MLVIIRSRSKQIHRKVYPLKLDKITISVFKGFIIINNSYISSNGIELYFPNKNRIVNSKCTFVYQDNEYELLLISDLIKHYKFEYYSFQYPITIGSSSLSDIVISGIEDTVINKYHLSRYLFVNDQYLDSFEIGDTIEIGQLIVIIADDFIMVNSKYDDINLDLFQANKTTSIECLTKDYDIAYKLNKTPKVLDYKLPKPVSFKTYEPQSLLASIGPGLTMAFASFGLALFNSFDHIQQGKAIERIIPSFIFPLAILISLLFWQPLNRYLERRRIKSINLTSYNEYQDKLDLLENKIREDVLLYKEHYNQLSFSSKPYGLSKYHHSYNELIILNVSPYPLINIDELNDDNSELVSETCVFIKELDKYHIPVIFSFIRDKIITVVNEVEVIKILILQYLYHRNYLDLKCVVIGDYQIIDELLKLKHFYNNHRKLVFSSYKEFVEYEDHLSNKEVLIIMINTNYPPLKKEYRYIGYYDHIKDIKIQTKFLISKKELYYDNRIYEISYDTSEYRKEINNLLLYNIVCNDHQRDIKSSFFQLNKITELSSSMLQRLWIKGSLDIDLGYDDEHNKHGINIHETKDGPHGLIAGTTGSGKSELIITLLLGLIYKNDYLRLNIIIVDFKGNNIASLLKDFPHVVGTISNLDLRLIDRLIVSLKNECHKREAVLANMTSLLNTPIQNIDDYNKYYKSIEGYKLMSNLVIVIDEFAELKRLCPLFIEELISLARVGRSLGFHLIMATQKPSGVVDSQIWSNMQFKICLKVMDKQDSTEMIDDTQAYYLNEAGQFILKSKRKKVYAKSVLSTTSIIDSNSYNEVKVYYDDGTVKKNKDKNENFNSQIQAIKALCLEVQKERNDQSKQMWLAPLKPQIVNTLIDKYQVTNSQIIGEYDDLDGATQGASIIDYYPILFVIDSESSVNDMVNRLLQSISYLNKEIIVIDSNIDNYISIIKSIQFLDSNILGNIEKFVNQDLTNYYVIIKDLECFKNNIGYLKGLLRQLSKNSQIALVSSRINLTTSIINHVKEVVYVGSDKQEYGGKHKLANDEAIRSNILVKLVQVGSVKLNFLIKNKMYLNSPIRQKYYKNKWLVGYNRYTITPIYLPYDIKIVVLGVHRDRFNQSICTKLSKTSTKEVLFWIDNDYPSSPFDPIKLANSNLEGLMYYEGKTIHIYLANE